MIFSGQRHSVSATGFYPQPSGWGRRFVQGSPPAGPHRPPHKARGHLESKTGQVWWVLYGNLRERLPPKSNISPPSMSQSCGGAEGTGNRRNPAVSPKIFRLNPLNFVRIPRVQTVKVTLGPLKKMEHFSSQVGTTQRSTLT